MEFVYDNKDLMPPGLGLCCRLSKVFDRSTSHQKQQRHARNCDGRADHSLPAEAFFEDEVA